jgi:hypothetical protein
MMWQAANQVILAERGAKRMPVCMRRALNRAPRKWSTPGVSWHDS